MNRLFTMTILAVLATILAVLLATLITLAVCNRWLGAWACRVMGWHLEPRDVGFDGCSATGRCPRCGKLVLQDSQGNWFAATNQDNP